MMKGLFFQATGSLANLTVEELPMPAPKGGEVLVQVVAAAINPSDVKNVQGKMPQTTLPRVPGRDFAGRVVSEDSHWRGKSVFGTGGDLGFGRDGSHAEFMAVPIEALVETPPEFSDENAASIGVIYLTAFAAIVRTGEVKSGETVLVTGTTGAVGSAAATIAHLKGARVLGTVRSRAELGRRTDLSFVEWIALDSRPLPESVKELTRGKGADLILDVVGGPLFQPCLESLAQRGRQIAIASAGNPQVTFNLVDFYHKEARLIGVDTLKLSFSESAEILKALLPGFKAAVFALPSVETVSLDGALHAYQAIDQGTSKKKVVIRFG
ncbi:MAG: zinc-binding alcohol dehydrogenase family protein [Candidatus Binatus sp.]